MMKRLLIFDFGCVIVLGVSIHLFDQLLSCICVSHNMAYRSIYKKFRLNPHVPGTISWKMKSIVSSRGKLFTIAALLLTKFIFIAIKLVAL